MNAISEREAQRRKRVRLDNVYYPSFAILLLAYGGAAYLICAQIETLFNLSHVPFSGNPYTIGLVVWGLAKGSATYLCHKCGVALAGRTVETIARPEARETGVEQLPPIYQKRTGDRYVLPVCFTGLLLLFVPGLLQRAGRLQNLGDLLFLGIVAFMAVAAYWGWKSIRKPTLDIDEWGIRACNDEGRFQQVPWERIAACDIVTEHNVFGKVESRTILVKDEHGKKLLQLKAEPKIEDYIAIELLGYRRAPETQSEEIADSR